MTPEERQKVAKELRKRVYGRKTVDVRESKHFRKSHLKDLKIWMI
jgi:hypothetical protein